MELSVLHINRVLSVMMRQVCKGARHRGQTGRGRDGDGDEYRRDSRETQELGLGLAAGLRDCGWSGISIAVAAVNCCSCSYESCVKCNKLRQFEACNKPSNNQHSALCSPVNSNLI